jgi:hypothetical protein
MMINKSWFCKKNADVFTKQKQKTWVIESDCVVFILIYVQISQMNLISSRSLTDNGSFNINFYKFLLSMNEINIKYLFPDFQAFFIDFVDELGLYSNFMASKWIILSIILKDLLSLRLLLLDHCTDGIGLNGISFNFWTLGQI